MKKLIFIILLIVFSSSYALANSIVKFDFEYTCKSNDGSIINTTFTEVKPKKPGPPMGDLYITKFTDQVGTVLHYTRHTDGFIYYAVVSNKQGIFNIVYFNKNEKNQLLATSINISPDDKVFYKMIPYEGRFGHELKDFEKLKNISDAKIANLLLPLVKIYSFYNEIYDSGVAQDYFLWGDQYVCS